MLFTPTTFLILNWMVCILFAYSVFVLLSKKQIFERKKNLIVALIIGIVCYLIIDMNGKLVYWISSDFRVEEYRMLGNKKIKLNGTKNSIEINFDQVAVVNESKKTLVIEPLNYSASHVDTSKEYVLEILPSSVGKCFLIRKKIDFFFGQETPSQIKSIHTSDIKYWLRIK